MRKPNYNFERQERDRAKQEKARAKLQKKADQAASGDAAPAVGTGQSSDAAPDTDDTAGSTRPNGS